jgi:hypothetical protein
MTTKFMGIAFGFAHSLCSILYFFAMCLVLLLLHTFHPIFVGTMVFFLAQRGHWTKSHPSS